jgi:hypothetical protein
MRRRTLFLLPATALAALAWTAYPRPTSPAAAADAGRPAAVGEGLQYQGVASCASAACHHGNGPAGSKGSEYSTWAAVDPHSRAASILADERSHRMVRSLKGLAAGARVQPEKEELCLRCHVLTDFSFTRTRRRDLFGVNDGVGCEACHGPAEKWLHEHYLKTWTHKAPGFRQTKDLAVRADLCVACHVGQGDADVNHDLIAAGHPRLRFDLAAFLVAYPKHWPEDADRRRLPDFAARAWLVGKLTAAEASLDLLAHRAAGALKKEAPWPEFSEYECAACHHNLHYDSERRKRGFSGKAGSLPWGSWYPALLPTLARNAPGGPVPIAPALEALEKSLRAPVPSEKDVVREAKQAAAQLRAWRSAVQQGGPLKLVQMRDLLATLAEDERAARANWDEATQLYLGMSALERGLADLGAEQPGLRKLLGSFAQELSAAFAGGSDSLYGTPTDFKPDRLAALLEEMRKRLR